MYVQLYRPLSKFKLPSGGTGGSGGIGGNRVQYILEELAFQKINIKFNNL